MEQDYKERAARAELAASQLDAALAALIAETGKIRLADLPHDRAVFDLTTAHNAARQARAAWTAHVDDYDTLDAAASPCEHCGHPTSCTDYDPDPVA